MAFCTSCGATLETSGRFCTQCGAAVAATVTAQSTSSQSGSGFAARPAMQAIPNSATAPASSNAVKIVLVVIAVLVGLTVIGGVTATLIGLKIARGVKVETQGDHARVVTPFGTVESDGDAVQAARNLGVDVYPGARPLPGASSVKMGGFSTVTASFETPDPPDAVQAWYHSRFPRSNLSVNDQNSHTLAFATDKGMVSIVIEATGRGSHIQISNVGGVGKPSAERSPN